MKVCTKKKERYNKRREKKREDNSDSKGSV